MKIKGSVKAKFPGARGFSYYNQKTAGDIDEAMRYVKRTWVEVEREGGTVVQAYLTPED